ncbi:flavodoxin family protein [Caproiciproducens sp.]
MNIRVIYHSSQSGNTEKLAKAIAEELNVKAERIGKEGISFPQPVDLLFVGDGIYWAKPHRITRKFFKKLNPAPIKNAAVFATYGNQFKIGDDLKTLLRDKGISVVGDPFTCRGASVGTKNQGHPDETDLQNIRAFARHIVDSVK